MEDEKPLYHWKWLFRAADTSDTDHVWTKAADPDDAIADANAARPGARIIRLVDCILAKGTK